VRNEKECVCSAPNCCDAKQRSASQPDSVASWTYCIMHVRCVYCAVRPESLNVIRDNFAV